MSPDILSIVDLELWTRIGVSDAEREAEQRLLVTVEMETDVRAVSSADDISRGTDYARAAEDIRALAKTERQTLERLAEDIAGLVLRTHNASSVTVTVKKSVLPGTKSVSVTIKRPRRSATG